MLSLADKLQLAVNLTIDVTAILINMMFILAIILRTPIHLRTYSVFLLNNAIFDLISAVASGLGTVRVIQDHEGSMICVFLGPCSLIDERLCRLCHAAHMDLVNQSTIILLLSFAFRLYVLSNSFTTGTSSSSLRIWLLCLSIFFSMSLHTVGYYLEQTSVSPEVINRLHLEGYTTSNFALFGSAWAVFLNACIALLSPVVMIIIFFVRRRLITRIHQSISIEKSHHVFIARALTYQMLLPCGLAIGAALWLCIAQIWSSEFAERTMMITSSMLSLASPLINFILLPPYRAILPFSQSKKVAANNAIMEFTTVAVQVAQY